jgi:hypothetical protein
MAGMEGGISNQTAGALFAGAEWVGWSQGISASGHAAFGGVPGGSSQPCMGLLSGHQSWEQPPAAAGCPPSLPPCLITLHYTTPVIGEN